MQTPGRGRLIRSLRIVWTQDERETHLGFATSTPELATTTLELATDTSELATSTPELATNILNSPQSTLNLPHTLKIINNQGEYNKDVLGSERNARCRSKSNLGA